MPTQVVAQQRTHPPEELFTVVEAARILKVSVHGLRHAVSDGRLPVTRIGSRVLVRRSTLDDLIEHGMLPRRRRSSETPITTSDQVGKQP